MLVLMIAKMNGERDQVGTLDVKVSSPAVQQSSSLTPARCLGAVLLLAGAGRTLVAAPAAALAPPELAGDVHTPEVPEAAEALEKGCGQRRGHAHDSGQAPADRTPAEEAVEVQPEKRACRSEPATSHPAVAEEPEAEPAAEEADAGNAEVQPKT